MPRARACGRRTSCRRGRPRARARSPGRRPPGSIPPSIEPLGIGARGIEHEQRFAELARELLCGAQKRLPDTAAPRAAVHQHLGQIGAVRLVFRQIEDQLHRADDARDRPRRPGARARPSARCCGNAAPEADRLVERERAHEAHRGAALDAVDQDLGKTADLRIGTAVASSDGSRTGSVHVLPRLGASRRSRSLKHEIQGLRGSSVPRGSKCAQGVEHGGRRRRRTADELRLLRREVPRSASRSRSSSVR